jgi:hypothetical protein
MNIQELFDAVARGDVDKMTEMLKNEPDFDVNATPGDEWTLLHECTATNNTRVLGFLLKYPGIDVNVRYWDWNGTTPLMSALFHKHDSCVRMLLSDPRTDATISDEYDITPLWLSCARSSLITVHLLFASGKELGDFNNTATSGSRVLNIFEVAAESGDAEISRLIDSYAKDKFVTIHLVRLHLEWTDAFVSDLFALIIFLCDDLLEIPTTIYQYLKGDYSPACRFFKIASRLPMELQMVLCNRAFGSMKDTVLTKDSEPAFRTHAIHFKQIVKKINNEGCDKKRLITL